MILRFAQAFLAASVLAFLWVIWMTWPPHVQRRHERRIFECRETGDPVTCLVVRYGWTRDSARLALEPAMR